MTWFQRIFWSLALSGLCYVVAILLLVFPVVQRNATYVHNLNPTWWHNLSNVEQFGFHRGQVQPFTVQSTDNVTLYAWHLVPTQLYRQHRERLDGASQSGLLSFDEAAQRPAMRLMLEDVNAHVVVSFHGNAAHLASSVRPATYQQLLSLSTPGHPVHVVAFDYRGFGLSTGSPTEQGVIDDGISILEALCAGQGTNKKTALATRLDPSQIILIGQSMGTFFSTASFYRWTIELGKKPFKALVLVAGFTSLPELLGSYSLKGLTPPILSPLTQYPWAQRWFLSKIVDRWDLAQRLQELVSKPDLDLRLTMMHATDDWEIPWREGIKNWDHVVRIANSTGNLDVVAKETTDELVYRWTSPDGRKHVKFDKIKHGGHNLVPVSEHFKSVMYDVLEQD